MGRECQSPQLLVHSHLESPPLLRSVLSSLPTTQRLLALQQLPCARNTGISSSCHLDQVRWMCILEVYSAIVLDTLCLTRTMLHDVQVLSGPESMSQSAKPALCITTGLGETLKMLRHIKCVDAYACTYVHLFDSVCCSKALPDCLNVSFASRSAAATQQKLSLCQQ